MAKQILKIILSLGAAALSILCGLNAEKLFVKNLGLVTIPVPNREIEPYTVISEDMFTTTEFTGYAGLPVPMAFISQSAGFYMDDPKLEIVSVPVAPGQMIGGNIYPDQYVNLYIRQKEGSNNPADVSWGFPNSPAAAEMAEDAFGYTKISNLKVSAVLDENGNDIYASDGKLSGKNHAAIIVLAVRPEQAQTIVEAAADSLRENSNTIVWVTIANSK